MTEPEEWRPVVGWEGLYEVSNLGRVRSRARLGGRNRMYGGGILRTRPDSAGYLRVNLSRDSQITTYRVHRLVGEAWLGPRPEGMETLHGAAGRSDNRLANLAYGTPLENSSDKVRDGTLNEGERNGQAKLTAEIVVDCRRRFAAGERQVTLATEFGVSIAAVSEAISGRTWHHIDPSVGRKRSRPRRSARQILLEERASRVTSQLYPSQGEEG